MENNSTVRDLKERPSTDGVVTASTIVSPPIRFTTLLAYLFTLHRLVGSCRIWQIYLSLLSLQIQQLNPAQVPSALKIGLEPHAHNLQRFLLRDHPLAE